MQASDVALDCRVSQEACPLNLVPTASTTAALALGDALAMTLLVAKGFREEEFANLHPGGKLGKRLMRAEQFMHTGDDAPFVSPATPMSEVLRNFAQGARHDLRRRRRRRLAGIITDGDLRRHMSDSVNLLDRTAADIMTRNPVTIEPGTLAVEALNVFEQRKITSIVVVDRPARRRCRAPARPLAHGDVLTQ